MSLSFPAYFLRLEHPFLKTHKRNTHNKLEYNVLSIIVWHLWQQKEKNSCNARVRVRAREGCIGVFTVQNLGLWIVFRAEVSSHQNVHKKQHVVLMKTTRRFGKNNTSFWRKQAVVLVKTSHRFIQKSPLMETKKKSCTHNLHKCKHKENFHAQKTRRCAENERKDVQKQRKSKEDIAKQKRHLPPICLKKAYYSNQIDVFNPLKSQNVKIKW